MNVDPVTLAEEICYGLCKSSSGLQTLIPRAGVPGEIKLYPHPAPEDVLAPFATHDIAGDETSAMPLGGGPGAFRVPWWVAVWTDQIQRQSLRPIVQALQAALVGPNMRGMSGEFTSGDGTSWQITIQRIGAMAAPAGVGDEGRYHRVMTRYDITILNSA